MPKLVSAVICERILTDESTNRVSYIDVLDGLTARLLPAGLPRVYVATVWRRSDDEVPEELRVRFRLLPPNSSKPAAEHITEGIDIKRRHRVNLNLQGAQIATTGEYTVAVDYGDGDKWRNASKLPFVISHTEAELPSTD